RLIPLLQTLRGIGPIAPLHDGPPELEYDADVELAELMHVFRVTPEMLSRSVPYLNVGSRPAARSSSSPTIGLVWQAGAWDRRRCIPAELLAPLAELKQVRFILFQHGP